MAIAKTIKPPVATAPKEYFGDSGFYVGGTAMPQASATPPSTSDVKPVPQIKLPEPNAANVYDEYVGSMTSNLETQRKAVEDAYKRQIGDIDKQQADAQSKMDKFTKQQEGVVGDIKSTLQPFREDLENGERNRLSINENFEANQGLVRELETLLTQSNNMMTQLKNSKIPGLAGISQSPRAIQAIADVSARVGVIQAVMSARSGQISEGYRMIDRSVDAINSDRKDQLAYYSTVYDFYQNQKDEEGKKLFQLDQKEQSYINKQIGLLESDMERSQATADYIKELMINPESAKFMADAGVTLNDSVETIQGKMAKQAEVEERRVAAKQNVKDLFDAGITTAYANKNGELVRVADGWSFKDPEEFKKMTGMSIEDAKAKGMISDYNADVVASRSQVLGLMDKYFDAGIKPGDDITTATQKAMRSSIYLDAIRPPGGGGGGAGGNVGPSVQNGLYNSTINEALLQGATPEEAVFAAMSLADQFGTKLSAKEQTALLQYARENQGKIAPPVEGGDASTTGAGVKLDNPVRNVSAEIPGAIGTIAKDVWSVDKAIGKGAYDAYKGIQEGIGNFFK